MFNWLLKIESKNLISKNLCLYVCLSVSHKPSYKNNINFTANNTKTATRYPQFNIYVISKLNILARHILTSNNSGEGGMLKKGLVPITALLLLHTGKIPC